MNRGHKKLRIFCIVVAIIILAVPTLIFVPYLDYISGYLGPWLLAQLIATAAALPYFILTFVLRRVDELQAQCDTLSYERFRVEEFLSSVENSTLPAAADHPSGDTGTDN